MSMTLDEIAADLREHMKQAQAIGYRIHRAAFIGATDSGPSCCAVGAIFAVGTLRRDADTYCGEVAKRWGTSTTDVWMLISGFDGCEVPEVQNNPFAQIGQRLAKEFIHDHEGENDQ